MNNEFIKEATEALGEKIHNLRTQLEGTQNRCRKLEQEINQVTTERDLYKHKDEIIELALTRFPLVNPEFRFTDRAYEIASLVSDPFNNDEIQPDQQHTIIQIEKIIGPTHTLRAGYFNNHKDTEILYLRSYYPNPTPTQP